MGTLVCFHAHPDDEAIATGGSMARAHEEGHRVVLVVATDGAHGETPDDLEPGETLVDRRRVETERSAAVLGVDRIVWLGYTDSGMVGWPHNDYEGSFHRADLDEAATRLLEVLYEERADVLTIYDWHGNYGHPDHIKVHRVGLRAIELFDGTVGGSPPRVFEATMNRDEIVRLMGEAAEAGLDPDEVDVPTDDTPFGMPEAELTHEVDVAAYVERKRAAIACHRSQITDSSFFLTLPLEQFGRAFGREWFIEHGRDPGMRPGWLFDR